MKETVNMLDFLHRENKLGKIAFRTSTASWVRPGMPSHAQACLYSQTFV